MRYLILGILLISILISSGCSQTIVKYQCLDGSFMDSANSCSSVSCKTDCPQLDCASCPVKTETEVETKTITNTVYVCSDGITEVKNKQECKKDTIETFMILKIDRNYMSLAIDLNTIILKNIGTKSLDNYHFKKFIYKDNEIFCESIGTGFLTEKIEPEQNASLLVPFPKCNPFDEMGRVKMTNGNYLWKIQLFDETNNLISEIKYTSEVEVINNGMGILVNSINPSS